MLRLRVGLLASVLASAIACFGVASCGSGSCAPPPPCRSLGFNQATCTCGAPQAFPAAGGNSAVADGGAAGEPGNGGDAGGTRGSASTCNDARCPSFACPAGTSLVTLPGQCCPSCVTPPDAGPVALRCTPLTSYCAAMAQKPTLYSRWPQAPRCIANWTTAQTAAAWCPADASALLYSVWIYPACHGYNRVVLGATDTSTSYLYDLASGQLVGIAGESLGGWTCIAGTIAAFDAPVGCDDNAGAAGAAPVCGQ